MVMLVLMTGKVPLVANSARPLVAIGKHLCGAATGELLNLV